MDLRLEKDALCSALFQKVLRKLANCNLKKDAPDWCSQEKFRFLEK